MADPLSNAAPVGGIGDFPPRARHEGQRRRSGPEAGAEPRQAADAVSVHAADLVARRLLRERVLARTRDRLGLAADAFVPHFAEAVDAEPVQAFVGRLIGAQNQLAGLRAATMPGPELRRHLDAALRDGVEEALELLDGDHQHGEAGAGVIAEVLAAYGELLARLADDESAS